MHSDRWFKQEVINQPPLDPLQGEILIQSDPTNPPFTPPPLPDPSEEKFPGSKMIYLVISKYVAESASYAFWKAGQMTYNLSTTDVMGKPLQS